MKDKILSLFTNPSEMTPEQIVLNIGIAAVLGFFIFISYYISHRGTIYSKKFNASLVILAALTGTVMTVIGNNIALSLGMVGALSIVRFRTAIKDSRDTVYIFWSIIVGICCGVGDYLVAADRGKTAAIKAQVYQLFRGKAVLRVENTTEETVELIYELSQSMLKKAEKKEKDLCSCLYALGNVEYVNIVMQNDEVSG